MNMAVIIPRPEQKQLAIWMNMTRADQSDLDEHGSKYT
jgi:hypothetical protein